jgi:hypothetical protein
MGDLPSKELIGKAIKSDTLLGPIRRMLEYDAKKRPTFNEMLEELGGQPIHEENGLQY